MKLASLLLASTSLFAAESNWPQFRGAGANSLGTGAPPVKWNGETGENILWKADVPGLGHSSPVIWGDRIFVSTSISADGGAASLKLGLYGDIKPVEGEGKQSFDVLCFERKSGKLLWQRTAASGVPKVKRHTKSTHANPTPATDGKHLVVSFGSEGLYTYDLNGKLLWKKDLGILDAGFFRVPSAQWGYASSPVIHGDMVIVLADVQKDSFLAAFDIKTGKEMWRTARGDVPTFGTPAVGPHAAGGTTGLQVVVNGWKHTGGYDLKTGKELWRLNGGGDIPTPTPVFDGGVVVVTSAHGSDRPIFAIRTDAAGDITGRKEAMAWAQERAGNYMQTPLIADGIGYFCMDNGILSVFQMATGEKLYQQRLGGGVSGFSGSPVAAGGRLYITNEDGHSYVIEQGGAYKLVAENDLGETVMSTAAILDGVIYARGRSHLFAIAGKKR
ncbi:MAG: pyrrolo-quinoline quinone [Bryobacterales bacterium]|nr:pyrrolo-quinoline quinone [Bryobacterales bacterium]